MSTPPWRERRERLQSPTLEAGVYAGERYRDPVAAALSPSHSFDQPPVEQGVRRGGGSAARRLRLDGQAPQTTALTPAGGNVRLQRLESAVDTIARVLGTAENCENAPAEAPARGHLYESSHVKSWKAKLAAAEAEAEAHKEDAAAAWEEAMQAYAERDNLQCQLGEARALIIELRERLSLEATAPAGPSPEVRRAVALRRSARLLHGTR